MICSVTGSLPMRTKVPLKVNVDSASVMGPALTVTAVAVASGMTMPPATTTLSEARRG